LENTGSAKSQRLDWYCSCYQNNQRWIQWTAE